MLRGKSGSLVRCAGGIGRAALQDKAVVAISAFGIAGFVDFKPHAGMAERGGFEPPGRTDAVGAVASVMLGSKLS